MGKTAAERRALLMSTCPSIAIVHVGEKTTVISDVNRGAHAKSEKEVETSEQ